MGRRTVTSQLHAMGITAALELALADPASIRRNFTVVEPTVREDGESRIDLEVALPKRQIRCTGSFGQRMTTYESRRRESPVHAERAAKDCARN